MALLQQVKEGSFLDATLDFSLPFEPGDWMVSSGVHCKLLMRGVLQVTPPQLQGHEKDIVLSSGIHGDETSPIELVQRLAQAIMQGRVIPAHRLLLIIGHPEAINAHTRYVDENMNRLFHEQNDQRNIDCLLANLLQKVVSQFYAGSKAEYKDRWHLDMHCAIRNSKHYTFAISPYSTKPSRSNRLFSFLQRAEIEAVLMSNSPASTFSWYSAEYYGAQAVTLELGKVAEFGQNDLTLLEPFYNALLALVTEQDLAMEWQDDATHVYKVTRTLIKHTEALAFTFPDDLANFTFFEQGKLLGRDDEVEYFSLAGGEAVVFPNADVAVGQRACLLVQEAKVNFSDQITVQQ